MTKRGSVHLIALFGVIFVIAGALFIISKLDKKDSLPVSPKRQITSDFGSLLRSDVVLVSPGPTIQPFASPTPVIAVRPSPSPSPKPASPIIPASPIQKECTSYNDAYSFREFIFCAFGFREEAADHIRKTTSISIKDLNSTSGGGLWYGFSRKVELLTAQREAAVHELSHAFWEDERNNSQRRLSLVKDLIKLATLDKNTNSRYITVINFAYEYVYGAGNWKGMFCAYDQKTCVNKNPSLLTDQEIIDYTSRWVILDHEIYAGFASFTMGKIITGSHQLPQFMASHFTEQFSGNLKVTPYYEGGPH